MTPNIHNVKSKDILKFMLQNWFKISHQKWSHIQLKKWIFKITIPNHWSKTLNIKTTLSIFRQSWIDKNDFLEK
jgi:predicted RNA binding protein YcfA (HicA-like mRNA interferase family)